MHPRFSISTEVKKKGRARDLRKILCCPTKWQTDASTKYDGVVLYQLIIHFNVYVHFRSEYFGAQIKAEK
jgi:hypothetical protein